MVIALPKLYSLYITEENSDCPQSTEYANNYIESELALNPMFPVETVQYVTQDELIGKQLQKIKSWKEQTKYISRLPLDEGYFLKDKIIYNVVFEDNQKAEITFSKIQKGVLVCPIKITSKQNDPRTVTIKLIQ